MEKVKKRVRKARTKKEHTLSVKERSKIHRERKKQYYLDLEQKVSVLESENKQLKARIAELEFSTKGEEIKEENEKLVREEDFMYKVLPKMIEKNSDQFRMSLYESSRDSQGAYGDERVKTIKTSFNKIIEAVIPQTFKALL